MALCRRDAGIESHAMERRRRLGSGDRGSSAAWVWWDERAGLPEHIEDVTWLPVTNKGALMAHFDEVATEPAVTLAAVQEFVADPACIGRRFAGKYLVATTGTRGIFVLDDRYWAERRDEPRRHRSLGVFSVHTPLPRLVAQLNGFGPALLGATPACCGCWPPSRKPGGCRCTRCWCSARLRGCRRPSGTAWSWPSGLSFGEVYGCTESGYSAYGGAQGWLHLLEDWVIVEPVDADHRPVPQGTVSHTVLITNLANRVQPIIRYDVGDRVLVRPDPCPCGDPAPAIRVQRRASDVLTLPAAGGRGMVTVPPLALGTVVDRTPGVELFQIVQAAPTRLSVRLRPDAGADPERVRAGVRKGITAVLTDLGLAHVTVDSAPEPPEQTTGGKYRTVIPLPARPPSS